MGRYSIPFQELVKIWKNIYQISSQAKSKSQAGYHKPSIIRLLIGYELIKKKEVKKEGLFVYVYSKTPLPSLPPGIRGAVIKYLKNTPKS